MIPAPRPSRTFLRRIGIGLGALLGAVFALGAAPPPSEEDYRYLETLERVFNTAYHKVNPAVVLITTTRQWPFVQNLLPPDHPVLPEGGTGMGSGTIVSSDGYILSNYHVVSDTDSIIVTLADQRAFEAQVVGFDSLIDIALLKIEATQLPVVQLGDSDQVDIGDWVLAIGHPLGLRTTLTHGIVSALGRQAEVLKGAYRIESFIQTNADINPGNSGGPLIDLRGRVIGINTAISTRTGYFMGYGLAVPINLARQAMDDLLVHGRVVRGYLGISMETVAQTHINRFDLALDKPRGVYVVSSQKDSPAAQGGIQSGDVILHIEDQPVDRTNQIQTFIYNKEPGDTVQVNILRDGLQQKLEVVLGEREEDERLARGHQRLAELGLKVTTLSDDIARELGFSDDIATQLGYQDQEQALVVTAVDPDGLAASKGIQVHDVITEIDQERITSMGQLVHLISRLKDDQSALFWFWRADHGIDVRALKVSD
ncbi:MAG: PDZ domain-containing protein [Candidatus Latescibacteria bacterium]|nr:PDZ domain-containing protein [Candidatus Latescibacterota bacterium]